MLFPLWTVLFAGLALVRPSSFAWFTTKYFTARLGILMLSMGITLTVADFERVAQQPTAVLVGFALCYVLCPILGISLGKLFNLPLDLVAGLVLVGSVNGLVSFLYSYLYLYLNFSVTFNVIYPNPRLFHLVSGQVHSFFGHTFLITYCYLAYLVCT